MKYLTFVFLIFSLSANAYEYTVKIDISDCADKSCFSLIQETFNVADNLKVVAWADITDVLDKGQPSFYPLFNVYNTSTATVNLETGMQLLDENHSVLIEKIDKTSFTPYDDSESQYKIYRSLNAFDLTDTMFNNAKFVTIIVKNKE